MRAVARLLFAALFVCLAASAASYIGLSVVDLTPQRAQDLHVTTGVEVMAVQPRSPAATAGLRPHDVLVAINGQEVSGGDELKRLISDTSPGTRVRIDYLRAGVEHRVELQTAQKAGAPAAEEPDFRFPSLDQLGMPVDIPRPIIIWRNNLLGIEGEGIGAELATYFGVQHGLFVRDVQPGSPAWHAGLRPGDVVFQAGERPVYNTRDLTEALRAQPPAAKKTIKVAVMRDHKRVALDLVVGD